MQANVVNYNHSNSLNLSYTNEIIFRITTTMWGYSIVHIKGCRVNNFQNIVFLCLMI